MEFRTLWTVDPQDFSKGQGGFQGGFFRLKGITDRDHASLEAACAAIERTGRYVRMAHPTGSADALYQYKDGRKKWLVVSRVERPVDSRPHVLGACRIRCAACALAGAL